MTVLAIIAVLVGYASMASAQPIAVGARIQVGPAGINVRATPAGALLGAQPPGAFGVVKAGPQSAPLGGVAVTWWQIDYDAGVDGWSGQDNLVLAPTYPGAAAIASASRVDVVSIPLRWNDAAPGNGAVFGLERGPAIAGPFVRLITLNEGTTFYDDAGVQPGQSYCYRVREERASFTPSAYSNVVCGTP